MQCQEDSSIPPFHRTQHSHNFQGTLETDEGGVTPPFAKHQPRRKKDVQENIPDPSVLVRRRILFFMIGICAVMIFTLVQAGNNSRTILFESPNDREPTFPIDERPRDPFSENPMDTGSFSNSIALVDKNLSAWTGSYNGEVFLDENWKPGDWTLSISKEGGVSLNNVQLVDYTYIDENSTLSWKSQYCGPFQTSQCEGSIEFDALITFNKTNESNDETLPGSFTSNNATETFFYGYAGLFKCRGFSASTIDP